VLCLLTAVLCAPALFAQDAPAAGTAASDAGDEGDFFGTAPVEAPQGTADKQKILEDVDKERVGLSGILQATGTYNLTRDFVLGSEGVERNPLSGMMSGDFLVDVRLKKSFRAFTDLSLGYISSATPVVTLLGVKEIFVDFNAANTVYFRAGKQVLQWGTGYFWNPTDLINIEHKSFTNLDALREGVFGLRSDVVFAREFHLYTFLNLNGITDISGIALAARTEFLIGSFELGLAGWFKPNKIPVFGVDLSTPLFWNLNLTGEASVSWGDNQDKLNTSGNAYPVRDRLVPKIDVGLSRSFDAGDVQDRIMVNAEFFYNDSGYDQNMFDLFSGNAAARTTFLTGGYYHPGYYGRYYGALFVTVNKFLVSELTLSLSGIENFSDRTGIALAMLTYTPVNNFALSLQVGSYLSLGAATGEYTISPNLTGDLGGNMFFASLGAKVSF
jgi:hypothetical protein